MFPLDRYALAIALSLSAVGCAAETDGYPLPDAGAAVSCSLLGGGREPIGAEVLQAFYTCCEGAAHLIPESKVPESFRGLLEKGPQQTVCVPDVLAADPEWAPTPCTSKGGQGACLTTCIPLVRTLYGGYERADCGHQEVCIPYLDWVVDLADSLICGGQPQTDAGA